MAGNGEYRYSRLTRIIHEGSSRGCGDGLYDGQPQGLAPEAWLNTMSQGARPEDARQNAQIRSRSRTFMNNPG